MPSNNQKAIGILCGHPAEVIWNLQLVKSSEIKILHDVEFVF